jgi:hypothetical protein
MNLFGSWPATWEVPNHYFDCEAMQAAAATMLKLIGREAVMFAEQLSKDPAPETREPASKRSNISD